MLHYGECRQMLEKGTLILEGCTENTQSWLQTCCQSIGTRQGLVRGSVLSSPMIWIYRTGTPWRFTTGLLWRHPWWCLSRGRKIKSMRTITGYELPGTRFLGPGCQRHWKDQKYTSSVWLLEAPASFCGLMETIIQGITTPWCAPMTFCVTLGTPSWCFPS